MENFFREQQRLIESVSSTKRYLYDRIDWKERCIGILKQSDRPTVTPLRRSLPDSFQAAAHNSGVSGMKEKTLGSHRERQAPYPTWLPASVRQG